VGTQQAAGYSYDAFGQRLVRSGASAGLYQYDLGGHLIEETDGQGNTQADYIYLGDQPIASVSPSSGQVYFLHSDHLGTPQVATDSNQAVQWQASYQPFGATTTGIGLIVQDLRLPGQEYDSVTGWNHNGFRDYIPGLGRYSQSDPVGLAGGLNSFVYARNSPLVFRDPTGRFIVVLDYEPSPTPTGQGVYSGEPIVWADGHDLKAPWVLHDAISAVCGLVFGGADKTQTDPPIVWADGDPGTQFKWRELPSILRALIFGSADSTVDSHTEQPAQCNPALQSCALPKPRLPAPQVLFPIEGQLILR
jgi:RHS repeat-associated protein